MNANERRVLVAAVRAVDDYVKNVGYARIHELSPVLATSMNVLHMTVGIMDYVNAAKKPRKSRPPR
jgi:hypothetical protein